MTGRTIWDFLWDILQKVFSFGGVTCIILVVIIIAFIYIVVHPEIPREWNTNITLFLARYFPKKRQGAFEKKLSFTVAAVQKKFENIAPNFFKKFLPYQLKK